MAGNKTVSRAVVEALVGEGENRVFGLPGNPIHLVADLEKHSDIENVLVRVEKSLSQPWINPSLR